MNLVDDNAHAKLKRTTSLPELAYKPALVRGTERPLSRLFRRRDPIPRARLPMPRTNLCEFAFNRADSKH